MSKQISLCTKIVQSKNQTSADLDKETIVLTQLEGVYYGLPGVGQQVWKLISRPRAVEEIVEIVTRNYKVPPSRCGRDLLLFFERLQDAQLISVIE